MARNTRSTERKKKKSDSNYQTDYDEGEGNHGVEDTSSPLPSTPQGGEAQSTRKSTKRRKSARVQMSASRSEKYDHSRFVAVEKNIGKILHIISKKERRSSQREKQEKTPSRKRHLPPRKDGRGKKRRLAREFEVTEDSDTSETESECDTADSSMSEEDDGIDRIQFDMDAMTGKPAKRSKSKSRIKYKYPRPYMYLPRPVLEEVKERDSYDNLSYQEFVWGMVRLIKSTHKADDATALLLSHLEMVAEDAARFKWESVRDFSNACFDKADRREMSWRDGTQIRDFRIKNSWISGPRAPAVPEPCHAFNVDTCDKQDGHQERGFKARHRCAICWMVAGLKECTHAAKFCNRKGEMTQKQGGYNNARGTYKQSQYNKKSGGNAAPEAQASDRGHPKN